MKFSQLAESAMNQAIATAITQDARQGACAIHQIVALEVKNYPFHPGLIEAIVNGTIKGFNHNKEQFLDSYTRMGSLRIVIGEYVDNILNYSAKLDTPSEEENRKIEAKLHDSSFHIINASAAYADLLNQSQVSHRLD